MDEERGKVNMAPLLSIAEAAEILSIPMTTLRDKVTARAVPHTRIGRHVRFTPEHIAEIIALGEQSVRPTTAPRDVMAPTGRRRRRA